MAFSPEQLAKMRAEFDKIEAQTSNQGGDFVNNFFQPPIGDATLRILPSSDENEVFYAETAIHRVPMGNGQTKNVHCRKVHDELCPVCDAYRALWKSPFGTKEHEALGRSIKPRNRYYMNVVDRETDEVKIFSVGIQLFKKIINTTLDPEFGDITDLEEGRDFRLNKVMEQTSTGNWPKYDQSAFRPKVTAAGTKKSIAEYMDSLHDIQGLIRLEDYEMCKTLAASLLATGEGSIEASPAVAAAVAEKPADTPPVDDENYLERLQSN